MSRWRMPAMCADCPFQPTGPGAHLRRTLGPGRMAEIRAALRAGGHFLCHKTTRATGDGSNRQCAGALAYQARRGIANQLTRIEERLAAIFGARTRTKKPTVP